MLRRTFNNLLLSAGLTTFFSIKKPEFEEDCVTNFTFNKMDFKIKATQRIILRVDQNQILGLYHEKTNLRMGTIHCHPPINYAGIVIHSDPILIVPNSECLKQKHVTLLRHLTASYYVSYIEEKPSKEINIPELNLKYTVSVRKPSHDFSIS